MKKLLALWMGFLLLVLTATIWALVTVKPPKKPDCSKSIELFSHYLGLGTLAAENGQDISGYKADMLAAIRHNPTCFPQSFADLAQ